MLSFKKIYLIIFIIFVCYSTYLLVTKKNGKFELSDTIFGHSAIIKGGEVYFYEKGILDKKLNFDQGKINNDQTMNLSGNIKLYDKNKGQPIDAIAEKATVKLKNLGSEIKYFSEPENIIIRENIQIKTQDHNFKTEFAIIDFDNKMIHSRTEVDVHGVNGNMVSETGFEYSIQTSELKLFGPVVGHLNEI